MIHFTRRNLDNYLYAFAFISIAITLNACGFQLRGSINLSEDISPIYIEQNSVFDLAREIRSLLATNKIKVVEDVKQSKAQLTLLSEEKIRRVLSVDGNGRAREYLLIYKVNFVINTKQPETLEVETQKTETMEAKNNEGSISHDSISVSRSLLFDPDAVLAVTNEAEILYRDMRRETARLILLKLQARSINPSGVRDKPVSDPALDKAKSL
jgi:LPS-assembly lipoprotein